MAVDDKQIDPSVVIVIKEFGAPAHVRKTYRGDFSRVRNVGERTSAVVMVERVVVVVEVSYKQVGLSVMVEIRPDRGEAEQVIGIVNPGLF